ncbi:conjugal transfer protein TrbJ [Brevundimonas sp. SL130]|uniref:conjugal transfer protein TrbJ n=1 Tax=Brevundimonas sp. SL130 TaxID=2995143 RepID=UPI00226CCBD9|nr:conjugal transfer protein TrbJ [Brevundimonas sp. SL130]WAC61383.1 conjugal transfer protein TrbJ [Brevundimonas sp. SL130]
MWNPSSTPSRVRSRPNRLTLALTLAALSASTPAAAQQVVFDPRNHLENALQAARQLESLANEARSLAASPYSHLAGSNQALRDMGELARSAQGLAASADQIEGQFDRLYDLDLSRADLPDLRTQGEARAQTARRTAEDVARTAAELDRMAQARESRLSGALSASQAATGQTAAIQSSNQMLAVLAEELAALRTASLAQARLSAEQAARANADQAAGDAARRLRWAGEAGAPAAPAFDPFTRAAD